VVSTVARAARWRVLFEPGRRPPLWETTKATLIGLFFNSILPLRRPGHGLLGFAWTVFSWLVIALSVWSLMVGFGLQLSFLAAVLATVAVGLAFIVPAAPSAVGVFEAAAIAATNAYGVPQSQGLAFAVVLHALNLFPFIAAGLVLLAMLPRPSAVGRADESAYGARGSQSGHAR
jgi:uncharacterized membrane protein YbhN (UPF0104 family)